MRRLIFLSAALALLAGPAIAQQVLIDQGMRLEGLWVFPSVTDPSQFYYVPGIAKLASDERGNPDFSFLRYVINRKTDEGESRGITSAEGGAILTFLVTYDTPLDLQRRVERAIRQRTANDDAVLRGPVIFKEGRYLLVSSIVAPSGETEKVALAAGTAPVFEGNEIAFSFDLDPQRSKLLLESFKMDTPDLSVVFEMTFEGLSDAYEAELDINWDEVQKSTTLGFGVSAMYGVLGADIEKGFEELRKSNAIKLRTRGASENMDALLETVMSKLLGIMFKKAPAPKQEPESQDGIMSLLSSVADVATDPQESVKRGSTVAVTARYEHKQIKKSGVTTLNFNSQLPVERNTMFVLNVGDLNERFGEDENYFRTVNLADPAFQQREIYVGLDGSILPEFENYINSVTVTLRKQHENGAETLQEVVLDRETFNKEKRDFRMVYGWNEDHDRDAWLEYDYRTRWSFKGGGLYETDWQRTQTNMIDLFAPYNRSTVELIGDHETLKEKGVRGVAVQVQYPFFDGRRSADLSVTTREAFDGKELEITMPLDVLEYDYTITWIRRGAAPLVASGKDDTGILFVDTLPEEGGEAPDE